MRESAYLKRIAAALRPQSVNADELTPEEIIDQWQPNLDPIDMNDHLKRLQNLKPQQ